MSKLTLYVLIVCQSFAMAMAHESSAQRKYLKDINIELGIASDQVEIPLKELIKEVETSSNFTFAYTRGGIRNKTICLNSKNWNMLSLLKEISVQGRFSITRVNETITLIPADDGKLPEVKEESRIQQTVSGTVTDENEEPLPGATIIEKGTSNGTVTAIDGNFSLKVEENATLIFSFVGYQEQEVAVNNQSVINVSMVPDLASLDEIVIIGYGSVERKDLTGSVASVDAESIEKINTPSLNDALQGMAAGVQVSAQSGKPGEGSNIIIRGGSSISASNEPLYVIDGFPQLGGDNMSLNPQNIESIHVLKDASAGAIYGARAANGVVIITTKSGSKNERPQISYTSRFSFSSPIRKMETMDIVEFATVQKALASNAADSAYYANPQTFADSTSIDWQDALFRSALTQTHDLQISGGGNNSKYSASLGYYNQEGIVKNTSYSRINSRLRLENELSNKFNSGVNISFTSGKNLGTSFVGQQGLGMNALVLRPYLPGGEFGGSLADYDDPTYNVAGASNPLRTLEKSLVESNNLQFRTINFLEYEAFENFTLKASGSLDYYTSKNKSYQPSDIGFASAYNGIANISQSQVTTWLYENTAKYKFNIAEHDIEALAGFSAQTTIGESLNVRSTNFPIETLGADNIGLGVDLTNPSSNKYKATMSSFFGRLNYSFADKYLLTGTMRYDGSSNFGEANKWGVFPSAALAWRASEEYFIKNLNIFSDLKFRVSYGITGNNSIGNYVSLLTYTNANISVNSAQALGQRPRSMPNSDLKWEENQQLDVGFDMSLFEGKLNITADYYKKKSKDLLLNAPIPINSGFTTFTNNIGDIQASGYELDIRGVILNGKLKWTSQFNISFPSTKVLKLSDTDYFYTGTAGHKQNVFIVKEGEPLGAIYGYVYDGVNQNEDEVENLPQWGGVGQVEGPRYKDISGPEGVPDGVIDAEYDRTILGNGLPDVFGGFTNNFSFMNFDLSFIFTYRFGNEVLNANKNFLTPSINRGGPSYMLDAWTPENPTNEQWAWGKDSGVEFYNVTSWLVEDGSFIRLNNITLGYSLPEALLQKIKIQNFRVFVSGDKILTFSDYKGYDPEVSGTSSMLTPGIDLTAYPHQKKMTVGATITF